MSHLLLALLHRLRNPNHQMWAEDMNQSGMKSGKVWFCHDCQKGFWPVDSPLRCHPDTIYREPPWLR